jgi:peptidoglycan hydrolase-like protein with peptidoglycan-binding domain
MSARGMLTVVGTAVGGLIGWNDRPLTTADPASLRALFADLGRPVGADPAELTAAVRRFQAAVGLEPDGEAGPRTVHLLVRYAQEARDLRRFSDAAAA